jgi:hypothetical protein
MMTKRWMKKMKIQDVRASKHQGFKNTFDVAYNK